MLLIVAAAFLLATWPRNRLAFDFQVENKAPSDATTNTSPRIWPQFRGPFQGHSGPSHGFPLVWSEKTNVTWKTEVPGVGWSSPVVSETRIWLTSALQDGRSLRAFAFDKHSGKLLLEQEVLNLANASAKHAVNSHASPTPALDKDRVYVAFGPHGLAALDARSGKVIWKNTNLKFDDENMGGGASPILTERFVVIHCDGTDERFIVALNKSTGEVAWKTARSNPIKQATPYRKAFSTPVLSLLNGAEQLISSSSYRVFGYDPETGQELWTVETPNFCPVPTPLVQNDWIFACAGFDKAQLCAFHKESGKAPVLAWKSTRSIPLVPSPVLVGQHIYTVSDGGIASCLEAASGRTVWNERIGGKFWASLLHSEGRIYCFAEDGSAKILSATPKFHILATNRLDGEIMATPAMVDRALIVRTKTHLYRLEEVGPAVPKASPSDPSASDVKRQP
jgi:outer membrane protein assembly factor BamB